LPETLKKIFYLLPKGDPLKLAVLLILMLIAAAMEVVGIGMIPAFVAIVADPERVMNIGWLQPVFSNLEVTSSRDLLIWGAGGLLGVFILKGAYIVWYNYFEARFLYHRRYIVSHRLMRAYMHAPYTFHLSRNTAELLRNLTSEVNVFTNRVLSMMLRMSREGIMALSILVFLFVMEPLITILIISLSGLGAGSFIFFNKKKMKEYGEEEQERRAKMYKALNQGLGGIKDARVLNREEEFIEQFRKEAFRSTQLQTYIRFIQQIPRPVVETTAVLGMLLVSIILVLQGRSMGAIIPILTLFAMATVRLMPSVQQLVSNYTRLRYNLVSLEPLYNDLKNLQEYHTHFLEDRKSVGVFEFRNQIEIKNMSYRYPQAESKALDDISFTIPKGNAVAFVGSSGAGKTTMVDVILGLLKPSEGSISVDGKNINESTSAWQQHIGYIPQTIYLGDETLRANIAFGLPKDKIDESKVWEAVKLAQLETLLDQLPRGLDTIVGEHGTRLSGGQRQRVGIARALYHNPKVLIMDEATSALDNITEKKITRAIEALKGDHTLIMIAHRLTTVKNCDILYFMEEGQIIQEGSYEELVDNNIKFREMALEG